LAAGLPLVAAPPAPLAPARLPALLAFVGRPAAPAVPVPIVVPLPAALPPAAGEPLAPAEASTPVPSLPLQATAATRLSSIAPAARRVLEIGPGSKERLVVRRSKLEPIPRKRRQSLAGSEFRGSIAGSLPRSANRARLSNWGCPRP
jgi:hypothetical protein